jgi:hypothetical protein
MPNNYNSTHKFHELTFKHSFDIDYSQLFNHKNFWTQCGPCGKTKPQEFKNNQTHNKLWHCICLIGSQRKNISILIINFQWHKKKGILTLKKKHEICHIFDYKLGTNNPMNIIVVHMVCCTNDLVSTTRIYIYWLIFSQKQKLESTLS